MPVVDEVGPCLIADHPVLVLEDDDGIAATP